MKRLLLALLLVPLVATAADEPREYPAQKHTKRHAELQCENLASMTLHPKDYRALSIHTEAQTAAVAHPEYEGYHIVVSYPYRNDGVRFACVFRDFRSGGFIRLREFGLMDEDGVINTTKVDPLF